MCVRMTSQFSPSLSTLSLSLCLCLSHPTFVAGFRVTVTSCSYAHTCSRRMCVSTEIESVLYLGYTRTYKPCLMHTPDSSSSAPRGRRA